MRVVFVMFLTLLAGCRGTIPAWNGKIWLNDANVSKPTRVLPNGDRIYSDYSTDEFHAARVMTKEDFDSFWKTYILGCKEWRDGLDMVSASEFMTYHAKALEDTRHDN